MNKRGRVIEAMKGREREAEARETRGKNERVDKK